MRVEKKKARRLFNEGIELTVIPCKLDVLKSWLTIRMIKNKWKNNETFDEYTQRFTKELCNNSNGYYLSYYIKGGNEDV